MDIESGGILVWFNVPNGDKKPYLFMRAPEKAPRLRGRSNYFWIPVLLRTACRDDWQIFAMPS